MSDKFHVNEKGEAGKCSAQKGGCPFGSESEHYSSAGDAQKAYESLQKSQIAPAISKTPTDSHSTTKNSTQIAATPGEEMTKHELNLYAYSIASHNMMPAVGQLRLLSMKKDRGEKTRETLQHIREVYLPTAVSDVASKLDGDSSTSAFLKEELEKCMNPIFEQYMEDPYAKVDLKAALQSWADAVANYSGKQ